MLNLDIFRNIFFSRLQRHSNWQTWSTSERNTTWELIGSANPTLEDQACHQGRFLSNGRKHIQTEREPASADCGSRHTWSKLQAESSSAVWWCSNLSLAVCECRWGSEIWCIQSPWTEYILRWTEHMSFFIRLCRPALENSKSNGGSSSWTFVSTWYSWTSSWRTPSPSSECASFNQCGHIFIYTYLYI